jgi:hypothetical protein
MPQVVVLTRSQRQGRHVGKCGQEGRKALSLREDVVSSHTKSDGRLVTIRDCVTHGKRHMKAIEEGRCGKSLERPPAQPTSISGEVDSLNANTLACYTSFERADTADRAQAFPVRSCGKSSDEEQPYSESERLVYLPVLLDLAWYVQSKSELRKLHILRT